MDVIKVDQDVAYVVISVHVRCKCMFQIFHLFFRRMLQVCLSGCCKCLSGYCISFAMTFQMFSGVFASVLDVCYKCFSCF
jgi:hypothetical protein